MGVVKVRVDFCSILELDVKEVPEKFIKDLEEWFKFIAMWDDGFRDSIANIMDANRIEEIGMGSLRYSLMIEVDGKTVVQKNDIFEEDVII